MSPPGADSGCIEEQTIHLVRPNFYISSSALSGLFCHRVTRCGEGHEAVALTVLVSNPHSGVDKSTHSAFVGQLQGMARGEPHNPLREERIPFKKAVNASATSLT